MAYTNPAHIVLKNVRLSYVHLDKPYSQQPGQEAKYSTQILVPKLPGDNKAKIDVAIQAATQAAINKFGKAFPTQPKVSVHDGDGVRPSDGQPYAETCHGCWVFTASNKQPVKVVDRELQPILDPTQIYSGMYANVGITFFGYNAPQNKGIGISLDNVQKTADGEPLGGERVSVEDDFGSPTADPPVYMPPATPYQQPTTPVAPYQQPVAPYQQPLAPLVFPDGFNYPPQN